MLPGRIQPQTRLMGQDQAQVLELPDMTNINYDPRLYKFSYQSGELSLLDELDILKDLRHRIRQYNEMQDFHYMLRLLTGVKKAWF